MGRVAIITGGAQGLGAAIARSFLAHDFTGCVPNGAGADLDPLSLVCKVVAVEGKPAVKLSDNPAKIAGPAAEVERYKRVFDYRMTQARPA